MRQMKPLEAPGEALREAAFDEEWGRPREHDLEGASGAGVLVPQALHGFGPVRGLLDLIDDEECATGIGLIDQQPRGVPLLGQPAASAQRGLVGGGEPVGQSRPLRDLRDQGRLPHLTGARDNLKKATRFPEASEKFFRVGARIRHITQHDEQIYSTR